MHLKQFTPAGLRAVTANGVDADGNVFGVAADAAGLYHAVAWTPVPELSSALLVVTATAALCAPQQAMKRCKKNAGRGVGAAGIARKWEGERRGSPALPALPSGLPPAACATTRLDAMPDYR
jgi:hypothetical protein